MTDDKGVPDGEGQEKRQPLAHAGMLLGQRLPPEIPIGRKKGQAHGHDMLLEFEGADRPPVAVLLHRNPDVGAVLDINPRAQEEGGHIEHDDRGGVGRRRPRTKALDECARRLSRRYHDGRRLKRDSRQQGDRQQEVNEEQDSPERSDRYDLEDDVHGVAPRLPILRDEAPDWRRLSNGSNHVTMSNTSQDRSVRRVFAVAMPAPSSRSGTTTAIEGVSPRE